jgi:putative membrane protein
MNDSLANDRTYLAWLRTAIALFGLGFVVAKIALIADSGGAVSDQDLYTVVGIITILCGATLIVVGYLQHAAVARQLVADGSAPSRWSRTVTEVAVSGALLLSVLVVVTT